jgi:EAL domain-containing protein (putative c-di-GMP-specific phosphodiesterase class I)
VGDEQLCPTVAAALEESGVDPADLALEVTETALVDESEVPARNLERLRAMGVRVLLDDFGTGYSSLSYLQRFPIDVLKIDRSFIARLGQEASAEAIVGAIVGMGHALGIQVVAEGIETRTQAGQAAELGCDYGQGFLFARPTPAVDVVTDGKSTPA